MHNCYTDGGVVGDGSNTADVMFIGIAPGKNEWEKSRRPFTGPAGKILRGTISAVGADPDSYFYTNLICWWEDAPTLDEIQACAERLRYEIDEVKPKLIILLGTIVSDYFLGKYKRGYLYWNNAEARWYLPTYHPAAFTYEKTKLDVADFARDISRINDYPDEPPIVNYKVAETPEEANDILWNLKGDTAIDVETSYDYKDFNYPDDNLVGYDDSKMLCFGVSNAEGTYVIPGRLIRYLKTGWGSRSEVRWIMQLGMFDTAQFRRLVNEPIRLSEDTLLEDYSLDERGGASEEDERAVGVHGLEDLAAQILGAPAYKINILKATAPELHEYNAKDTAYTYRIHTKLKPRQIADNVRDMYESILIPGANCLSEIQARGVYIDKEVLFRLGAKWAERWLVSNTRIQEEARELGWDRPYSLNLNSPQQIKHLLFDIMKLKPHKVYGTSTRKAVLEDFASEGVSWCQSLREFRQNDHILSTYVVGVENELKWDNRIHPQPVIHGSRGGRLAYHKPAIQTIPKHGVDPEFAEVRDMYSVENKETHCIIEADYRQAELWATAYLSGDEAMLEALQLGDAHGAVAKEVFGIDESHPQWKAYRELGKLLNFGTLYNRTAKGYVKDMWQGRKPPPGLESFHWSIREAQSFIDKWFKRHPQIREWQRAEIKYAFQNGEQVTRTGRKRRYWLPNFKTVNQSVNLGPQSLAHDYLFSSFMKLHSGWDSSLNKMIPSAKLEHANVLYEVHDAIILEAEREYLDETVHQIRSVMTEPKFGLGGIPVDIATGDTWYRVKPYNFSD